MRNVQEILHRAYSAVRASEMNKSVSTITLDHLLQERIDSIRKKKLIDLDAIEKDIDDVVKAAGAE